jgi:hypothetical protein
MVSTDCGFSCDPLGGSYYGPYGPKMGTMSAQLGSRWMSNGDPNGPKYGPHMEQHIGPVMAPLHAHARATMGPRIRPRTSPIWAHPNIGVDWAHMEKESFRNHRVFAVSQRNPKVRLHG